MNGHFVNKVFQTNNSTFWDTALRMFQYQYAQNPLYRLFCDNLKIIPKAVNAAAVIPFLPISFFKTHKVICGEFQPEVIFESSGTTKMMQSRHMVKHLDVYRKSFTKTFELFYGKPQEWCIVGLLPSYLERTGSSLVFMVKELIEASAHSYNGFYLNNTSELKRTIQLLEQQQQKTLLIGVTYALLDFAEQFPVSLKHTVVMETGGMKGRRKELMREQVHDILMKSFQVNTIHSEYGMTELLSQAYSHGGGIFKCPPWMKIMIRDEDDPMLLSEQGRGALNIIDLANIHSCSFIATDDVGEVFEDGSFKVLGRMDNSDVRGCSLLAF